MTRKGSRELVQTEATGGLTPFEEAERWFEAAFRRPLSLFGHRWLPRLRGMEMEEVNPSMDIFEEGDKIVVKAEMPGIKKEDVEVTVTDHTMRIMGEKKREEKVEKKNYYWEERSYGSFSRSFQLPSEVQTDKVEAKFKDGVLEVRIPKTEEAKSKEKKVKVE